MTSAPLVDRLAQRLDAAIYRWVRRSMPRLFARRRGEPLPVTLERRRIFILPTRYGVFFGVALMAMLFGGLQYDNSMVLALTFLLASTSLISILHTHRNLADLRVAEMVAQPTFAGEPARFQCRMLNPQDAEKRAIGVRRDGFTALTDVPARRFCVVEVPVPTARRGWLRPGRVRVFTEQPMGLFHAWSWLEPATYALVYPQPEPAGPAPPLATGSEQRSLGEQRGEDELVGLREYQSGDPMRHIAWKISAKTDQLLTKELAEPQSRGYVLDWETLQGLGTEQRLARLTRWVLEADREGRPYSLRLPDGELGPDTSGAHRERCLEALALFGLDKPPAEEGNDAPHLD